MIFKVFYQETKNEIPIRERTKTMYVQAESIRDVQNKLKNYPYNIEFIQQLDEAHLAFEKKLETFKVEKL